MAGANSGSVGKGKVMCAHEYPPYYSLQFRCTRCTEQVDAKLIIQELRAQLFDQECEISVLRLYGNKDCTAMADDELDKMRADGMT